MKFVNMDIRKRIENNNLKYRDIAQEIGITPVTLSRWINTKLTSNRKRSIEIAIDSLVFKRDFT